MSNLKNLPLIATIGVTCLFTEAADALTIKLDDTINPSVTITDQVPGDSNPAAGAVTYIGSLGSWIVNVTTGISAPSIQDALIDLNSINVYNGGQTPGTLKITIWDNNIPTSGLVMGHMGGAITSGTAAVSYGTFDGSNVIGLSSQSFGPVAFSGDTAAFAINGVPGIEVVLNIGETGTASFNTTLDSVPIPAAAYLFGSAMLGMVGIGYRHNRRQA